MALRDVLAPIVSHFEDKEKQKENERKEIHNWKTFYDNEGFSMQMYFVWAGDQYYFVSPIDWKENHEYKYNYIWTSPNHWYKHGNTIRPYYGTKEQFFGDGEFRDRGLQNVRDYCGKNLRYDATRHI